MHGLSVIKKNRLENRLPRGRDKRFKLELFDELIADAGGVKVATAAKRLQAEIIATDATFLAQMDRAIQRVLRLVPKYPENVGVLAKLDGYRRPIINSLSTSLDRFGYDRAVPPAKSLEEILAEDEEPEKGNEP